MRYYYNYITNFVKSEKLHFPFSLITASGGQSIAVTLHEILVLVADPVPLPGNTPDEM
jgi:hypothetical protein